MDLDVANLLDEDEEIAPGRLIAENDDFDENKGDLHVQRNPDDADASPVQADENRARSYPMIMRRIPTARGKM